MFNATLRDMGAPTGNAQDGLDAAGVTPPAGGDGIRGWLSGIYNRLGGTLTVALSSSNPLDVSDRSARLLGHVTVDTAPTTAVTGAFFQATQPVSLAANQSVNNAQVNGSAVVTSVTGVLDVMPRKRTGTTGLAPNYTASHITTSATTTITAATAYIQNVLIVVSGAGTAWTVKIQNKEATPKILYPATTAVVGTTQPLNLTEPVLATSGIDIITAGTTAGVVDVFITYWQ